MTAKDQAMPYGPLCALLTWLLLAGLMAGAGCAIFSPEPPPPPEPPPQPLGLVEEDRWLNVELGVYWLNPGGYEPERPLPEQTFLFGWQKNGLGARLWTPADAGDLRATARKLAKRQGWELAEEMAVSWQGRRAWDAKLSGPVLGGRLRLMQAPRAIFAVAALAPAEEAEAKGPELAAMIEGLRLLPPGDVLHTVRHPSETLSVVAMWYTGTVRNWPLLQEYNGLPDPRLRLGQDILVPANLVWRWDPLPGWVVRQAQAPPAEEPKEETPHGQAPVLELLPSGPK